MKLHGIQCLRGIAALFVVFCHLYIWEQHYFSTSPTLPDWLALGNVGVDIFFVISGFVMGYVTAQPLVTLSAQGEFLWRRFTRIYPLYWCVLFPVLGVWLIEPGWIHEQFDVLSSIFLTPHRYAPALKVGWTLTYELYFYLVASFIFRLNRPQRLVLTFCWFACLVLINVLINDPTFYGNAWLRLVLSPFNLEFFSGLALGLSIMNLPTFRKAISMSLLATALLGFLVVTPGITNYVDNAHDLSRAAILGPCALVLLFATVQLERGRHWTVPRSLIYLGDCSYPIYLIHLPITIACYRLLHLGFPQPSFWLMRLAELSILFLAIGAGHLIHVGLELPILVYSKKVGRRLFQSRYG